MEKGLSFKSGMDFALQMDEKDPLKDFRNRFYFPDENTVYLDGNSLGRLPLAALERIGEVAEYEWGKRLIRSWNEGWYSLSEKISDKIATVTGANPGEIVTGDSTSINLYKAAMAGIKLNRGRKTIVTDDLNFPTDIYILQGIINELGDGYKLKIIQSEDGTTMPETAISQAVDEDTAIVALSHVAFKSGFMHHMEKVSNMVHAKGGIIIWDLSHAGGAVPLHLSNSGADMAVGCTYKYMNGGPGSPAYLFVAKHLQEKITPAIWGWFGEANPFDFKLNYMPAEGIRKFLIGTPPIISLAAVEPGLDILIEAGMENLRHKSLLQSQYLIFLYEKHLKNYGFLLGSPENALQRGSHVSFQHPDAYPICRALINPEAGNPIVIPDFRAPDYIRIGIAPLYNTFQDIYATVQRISQIVEGGIHKKFAGEKELVT